MDPTTAKRRLRRLMVQRVLGLSPTARDEQDAALWIRFENLEGRAQASTVLLYVRAFPEEIPTRRLIEATLDAGRTLVCPRVDRRIKALRLFQIRDPSADLDPGTL
ncbi:MAG: 5-formyltetrahydrofolate cyclo-ligase, partial [Isosphaeraceae bacterium]